MRKILNFMVLAVLLPALLTATVLLTYLHFFAPGTRISGKWTASLDMTDQAAVTAIGWLQDIEGIDIEGISASMQEMENTVQDFTVEVTITLRRPPGRRGLLRRV